MSTKVSTSLAVAAALFLVSLACQSQTRPPAPPKPNVSPVPVTGTGNIGPEAAAVMKQLMFADALENHLPGPQSKDEGAADEPMRSFVEATAAARRGRRDEARRILRRALTLPETGTETRYSLATWKALRDLGEPPPANAAEVQGVVCELHNEAGIGTLAAYADGRARWLGGQHNYIVWENVRADAEVDALINALLKEAGPLVKRAPAAATHRAGETPREHFRVSVLTYGGVHVVEVFGPDIDGRSGYMAPVLMASVRLLDALNARAELLLKEGQPSPPGR